MQMLEDSFWEICKFKKQILEVRAQDLEEFSPTKRQNIRKKI